MKKVLGLVLAGVGSVVSVSAQITGSTDPTSIYSSAMTDYTAAVGIAIAAIGVGAAVMFIRKGLRARM